MCGITFSGKTTVARQLSKLLVAHMSVSTTSMLNGVCMEGKGLQSKNGRELTAWPAYAFRN
jgi:hypothetical protein